MAWAPVPGKYECHRFLLLHSIDGDTDGECLSLQKIAKGGLSVCFRGSGRGLCFGRGSDVSRMFLICVVQVEQMNKKWTF